ncbi:meiosis-specific protein ASY2-like [Eutrema salsugineum]|uniref:meiosis-specific protein ASY2-like n=1 Tax=Eutrema salsugineum TaxID=72664 RepID=UPI000CED334E|nr:meiosis-specific protein ASY2-like [Eutrema salsugineum]
MSSGGQRIESSLESGSRSEQEASGSSSSSPEVSSRSDTQSDRSESSLVELADRVRSDGASPRGEIATSLQIVPFEEDGRDGRAVEHVEEEVDEGGEEEDGQGGEEEQDEEARPRRKGSKRKGAIKNRLENIPSQMTVQRLEDFRSRYGFRGELMAPGPEDRPWLAPESWVMLYEAWFSLCHLWFPLPRLLTDYVHRRGIAFSQILPAGIRFMVAALLFGSEAGVDVDLRFFEEMTNVQKNNSIPGTYTIKARKDCSLVYPVNRTPSWEASFFYAKVDEALVVDTTRDFRSEWSRSIDRNVQLEAFPENYHENLQKIRAVGIQHWPDIHRRRVEAAITRITNASWRRESNLLERATAMAPIQVNAPSLAARLKAKKSGSKDRGPSAARPARTDPVPAQEEVEVVPQPEVNLETAAEGGVEAQSAEDQVSTRQVDDGADEATQSARREEKKQKKRKREEKKRKEEAEAARLAEKKKVVEAKAKGKKKKSSGDGDDGGQVGAEAASKRPRVDPAGDDKAKGIDWSFKFEYPESSEPFVNNVDKCAELFEMIRGSTSEVPPGTDGAFKDMASFAFKFIASCNRARGQYMRWLRNGAARLKDAQAAGKKAVKERDTAIEQQRVAEDNWQTMKRKAEQLDVGVKELTDKIEAMKQENLDLVNNLQIVNEAKIQVEKSIATEVVRAQRQADERIEAETTRIWADAEAKYSGRIDRLRIRVAQQEAIEKVKLDLVQARGTLECLDFLKEQEMSEAELRAELEFSKRDCEQKLDNLSFTDLEEGDLPPPYPETSDGGSDRDNAEDEENDEGGNEPEE